MNHMPPEDDGFHVDLTFSGRSKNYAKPVALIVALTGIVFIVLTMFTSLATHILPMSEEYLQVLVPIAADGAEPLSLQSLEHEITDKTLSVHGAILNRTDYPVSNVLVVVEMQETTGRFPQTIEAPIQPTELPANQMGQFMVSATMQEKPAAYLLKFRLMDGPFIPHKDDRAVTLGITGK